MLLDACRLAVGTLTALPVTPPHSIDRRRAGAAMAMAPLTAILLLVPLAAIVALSHLLGLPPLVQAVCCATVLTLATRGLHLDGLADTADGLTASYDRERALAVMRTGDVGPSGAAAIILTLALQIACGAALLGSPRGLGLAALALVTSRTALTWACVRGVPAARPDGLGATVAQSVPRSTVALVTAALTVAGVAVCRATGSPWWCGPVVVAAGLVATGALLRRCTTRVGGISGDVLGACVELTLAVALLAAAACA